MKIYVDGSTKNNGQDGQKSRILVMDDNKVVVDEVIGDFTSNEAEYLALLNGIQYAIRTYEQNDRVTFFSDSKIVVNQVTRKWYTKTNHLIPHNRNVQKALLYFDNALVKWISREKNKAGHYIEMTL